MGNKPIDPQDLLGFVINLDRRPDRLALFRNRFATVNSVINRLPAIDGSTINVERYWDMLNPWLKIFGTEKLIRGIIGCKLSHEAAWSIISKLDDKLYFVFEDDAIFLSDVIVPKLLDFSNIAPPQADLVWLNRNDLTAPLLLPIRAKQFADRFAPKLSLGTKSSDLITKFLIQKGKPSFKRWPGISSKTTEAYAIRPRYAAKLLEYTKPWSDAIDAQMRSANEHLEGHVYTIFPPWFDQDGRHDSDIQCA
jgi:GR25 family glycosyltransferase involved in LPS biosynthesis